MMLTRKREGDQSRRVFHRSEQQCTADMLGVSASCIGSTIGTEWMPCAQ